MTTHSAEYMRRYRDQRPKYVARTNAQNRARERARVRLAEMYPGVFARLYDEELAEENIHETPRQYRRLA